MKNWKEWAIFKPVVDLYHSFFNNDNGFSFRKLLAAFSIVGVAAKLSIAITDEPLKFKVIVVWLLFGAVCIGLVTIPELIKFIHINGKDDSDLDKK